MKYFLTIILILGFAGTAIFGFAAMPHDMDMVQSGIDCPAIFLKNGATCPRFGGSFADSAYHIGALKFFLSVNINEFLTGFFIVLATVFIIIRSSLDWFFIHLKSLFRALSRRFLFGVSEPPLKRVFMRWLSMHINSPSML